MEFGNQHLECKKILHDMANTAQLISFQILNIKDVTMDREMCTHVWHITLRGEIMKEKSFIFFDFLLLTLFAFSSPTSQMFEGLEVEN